MAESNVSPGPGGFLTENLPSPAVSSTSTYSVTGLPHPRGHALRPGSTKEDTVRRFVESKLMQINRRYVKKFGLQEPGDEVVGYGKISELCRDVETVINTLWLSGTPSLQIPYFLNIAHELNTWLTSFAPSPPATFSLLSKLDHCFASLLSGQDLETKETLPGFENGLRGGMSKTDMVRCKSIIHQTRVIVVEVMSREPEEETEEGEDGDLDEDPDEESDAPSAVSRTGILDEDDDDLHMNVARVYEHTVSLLGDTLDEVVETTAIGCGV